MRSLALEVSSAADQHEASVAEAPDVEVCRTERERYDAKVRPMLERMAAMSGEMPCCTMCMGTSVGGSGCMSMMEELERYGGVACGAPEMSSNRLETSRHCLAMRTFAQRQMQQASPMPRTTSSGPMKPPCPR
ncbi:MAG: hypothetical protein HYZ28_03055 [Myxococcales bacterium]|nr:hypothetical protein [Myxococcales bacterium]